jgi:hypothetical protein
MRQRFNEGKKPEASYYPAQTTAYLRDDSRQFTVRL